MIKRSLTAALAAILVICSISCFADDYDDIVIDTYSCDGFIMEEDATENYDYIESTEEPIELEGLDENGYDYVEDDSGSIDFLIESEFCDGSDDEMYIEMEDTYADVTSEGVPVDAEHFPDDIFRSLVSQDADTNNDGLLSEDEASIIDEVSVSYRQISTLAGIEYFTNLKILDCSMLRRNN